jgi:rhamnosyltransferase subunit B
MAREKTALFAWELGEGLGHLGNLRLIAEALKAEGFKPVYALRDAVTVRAVRGLEDAQIFAAPVWLNPVPPPRGRLSYADILLSHGFGSLQDLSQIVKAWDDLFEVIQPSLLVCDHAPGAMFSAFGRIPTATVGNGFTVPPTQGREFPAIVPGTEDHRSQAPLLEVMKTVQASFKRPEPRAVTEPFHGRFRGIYVFPEIDPYRRLRKEPVLGPIEPLPAPTPCPSKPHLFVYGVSNFDHIAKLIDGIANLSIDVSAYFRGRVGPSLDFLKSRGVTVYDTPPAMAQVIPQATAVFSHGGTGLTQAALAAGRPQIVAPRFMEADLTAQAIAELKTGVRLTQFDMAEFAKAVDETSNDGLLRRNALAFAQKFAAVARPDPLEVTRAALLSIAA